MQKGTPPLPLEVTLFQYLQPCLFFFFNKHGCEYQIIKHKNTFFPQIPVQTKCVFQKCFQKSLIHSQKKGVVCSVHANINISWQFSASSHHSQRTNLYMYLPEQYNRQNNSIALSQRFSVHFLSNFILNSGPIILFFFFFFFYSLPFYFIFLNKHYRTSSWY